MRKYTIYIVLMCFFYGCTNTNEPPKNLSRVETAYYEKGEYLEKVFRKKGLVLDKVEVFIRAFKEEQVLEVWAKAPTSTTYQKMLTYDFCAFSGTLGPKRQEGDLQIPEGCYHIDRWNPQSNFYLSLGLNYPNQSDAIRGVKNKLGYDIFIHGGCATIGCIPITDEKIKELYVLTEKAKLHQAQIPVHIFPAQLTTAKYNRIVAEQPNHRAFWNELKNIYTFFENHKQLPSLSITNDGGYEIIE